MIYAHKNYWLYIAPYVYCNRKETRVLLYNTKNGMSIETGDQVILDLLQSLHERENMGAIYCEGKMLAQNSYREFILDFCSKGMGNIIDVVQRPGKPIQMMPILNLQNDIEKLEIISDRDLGEEIMQYLLELNIYLHTVCKKCCQYCDTLFKQDLCCHTDVDKPQKTLNIATVENILSQIQYGVVGKLNLLGGDVFEYPYYKELKALLMDFKGQVHLWNHYANFVNSEKIVPDFIYDIIVPLPIDEYSWDLCLKLLPKDLRVKFHFYVTQNEEYEETVNLIDQNRVTNYSIHPVYKKTNYDFFAQYVYMDKEDIFDTKLPFNRIFAHQKLNTHFFGSLTILADGDIYANVNRLALGNIFNDTLLDITKKEILVNTAWRMIRNDPPCSGCLYQYLCPSPSNYEIIIGKANLCHVKG